MAESQISAQLPSISNWLSDNKPSLNFGKTEYILFASKIRLGRSPGFKVTVGDTAVTANNAVEYLGILRFLTGESMGQKINANVNQKVMFLSRKATFLDKGILKTLAAVLVQPHFDYACTTWYSK